MFLAQRKYLSQCNLSTMHCDKYLLCASKMYITMSIILIFYLTFQASELVPGLDQHVQPEQGYYQEDPRLEVILLQFNCLELTDTMYSLLAHKKHGWRVSVGSRGRNAQHH
jgi:hypothetical protein